MKPMHRNVYLAAMLALLAAAPLGAQGDPRSGLKAPGGPENELAQYLFPPELVMQYQQKIGLTTEQRDAIRGAITEMQTRVLDIQWKLQDEAQKLVELVQRSTVSETDALAQVDRVLSAEREVKRAQIGMLIRIKNKLTEQQQNTLRELQKAQSKALSPDGQRRQGGGASWPRERVLPR